MYFVNDFNKYFFSFNIHSIQRFWINLSSFEKSLLFFSWHFLFLQINVFRPLSPARCAPWPPCSASTRTTSAESLPRSGNRSRKSDSVSTASNVTTPIKASNRWNRFWSKKSIRATSFCRKASHPPTLSPWSQTLSSTFANKLESNTFEIQLPLFNIPFYKHSFWFSSSPNNPHFVSDC